MEFSGGMEIPAELLALDLDGLIGLPVDDARALVESAGGRLRVAAPDQPVTLEYRPDRVTVTAVNDVVVTQQGIG